MRESFVFHAEYIDDLPDEFRPTFAMYAINYGIYGNEPELSGLEIAIWAKIKRRIDFDRENWENVRDSRSNAGKSHKGNQYTKKNKMEQIGTNGTEFQSVGQTGTQPDKMEQVGTNGTVNVNVTDNVSVSVTDDVSVTESSYAAFAPPEPETPPSLPKKPPLTDREPVNDLERVEKAYLDHYASLYDKGILKIPKPCVNWGQCRKLERERITEYGLEKILTALEKAMQDDFCVQKGYSLSTILSAGMLNSLLNGNGWKHDQRAIDSVDRVTDEDYANILF